MYNLVYHWPGPGQLTGRLQWQQARKTLSCWLLGYTDIWQECTQKVCIDCRPRLVPKSIACPVTTTSTLVLFHCQSSEINKQHWYLAPVLEDWEPPMGLVHYLRLSRYLGHALEKVAFCTISWKGWLHSKRWAEYFILGQAYDIYAVLPKGWHTGNYDTLGNISMQCSFGPKFPGFLNFLQNRN